MNLPNSLTISLEGVVVISKVGRRVHILARDYRQISPAFFKTKILERILHILIREKSERTINGNGTTRSKPTH